MVKKITIGIIITIFVITGAVFAAFFSGNKRVTKDIEQKTINSAINKVANQKNLSVNEKTELNNAVTNILKTEENIKKMAEPYLRVDTQNIGDKIIVAYTNWNKNSFVVIKRPNGNRSNNFQDEILGISKILPAGKNEIIEVSLKSRVVGEVLYAYLYEDDGDSIFNELSDINVPDPRYENLKILQRFDVKTR